MATRTIAPLTLLIFLCTESITFSVVSLAYAYPPSYGDDSGSCSLRDDLVPVRREVYDDGRIFDISHRYREEMPAWGSSDGLGQFLWLPKSMKNGSLANNSEMKLPTHTGTHVDAPGHVYDHYFDAGFDVDTLDLAVLNGPALLVDVPRDKNITAEVMKSLNIPRGVRRVLFRTLNTDRGLMWKKEFDTSYVGFMKDGAKWLVENTDIKLVGVDYLSAAAYDDLIPSHLVFLESRCIFQDLETKKVIGIGREMNGVYLLEHSQGEQCEAGKFLVSQSCSKIMLWYNRLGHLSFGSLKSVFQTCLSQ